MILLSDLDFSLPLKNPVVIFSLVLFIILFAPILFSKIKVPHIIGLILAGVIVGPHGFNLLQRDSSILLFGTVGLLYIMFLAGLEIDLSEFKKNRNKIIVFGLTTFLLPLVVGTLASYYVLGFSFLSSVLLASMFSTHTLISYPIASRYGVTRNRAVTLTIGGTMITDILALLILAAVAGMTKEEVTSSFWVTLGLSSVILVAIIFFAFPFIIQWFFKKFDDAVSQYIFVLAIVFLSAFLAEAAGLEAIIGAFFSGLVLNKYIPHTSPLMNRIDFVGNALFIPFFLISVGMLVDVAVFVKGWGALRVAAVIVFVAIITKYFAAWITQKIFGLSKVEGNMIFGLSTSHAAATLAIILVGYNIIIGELPNGEPIRLLNEDVLNGTILLILISCAISSFVVQKASRTLALSEEGSEAARDTDDKVLVSLAYPENVTGLVDLALMLNQHGRGTPVYALTIVTDEGGEKAVSPPGRKVMQKAVQHAAASGNTLVPLTRHDVNIGNGIIYTIREQQVTDVVIGLHHNANSHDFFGNITDQLVNRVPETIFIYKVVQPLNTIQKMVIAITPNAELEPGFSHWFFKLCDVAKSSGLVMDFYAAENTIVSLKELQQSMASKPPMNFNRFENWEDFLALTGQVKKDDMLVIVTSRTGHISFQPALEKLPHYLTNYFVDNNFIILYPRQLQHGIRMDNIQHTDGSIAETFSDTAAAARKAGKFFGKYFGKKTQG